MIEDLMTIGESYPGQDHPILNQRIKKLPTIIQTPNYLYKYR